MDDSPSPSQARFGSAADMGNRSDSPDSSPRMSEKGRSPSLMSGSASGLGGGGGAATNKTGSSSGLPAATAAAAAAASASSGADDHHFGRRNENDDDVDDNNETDVEIGPLKFSREKYKALLAQLKVAKWHDTRHQIKIISNVLSGEELTQWFQQNGYAADEDEAVQLGGFLLKQKVLFPMLKRLGVRGFANTHELFYQQTPDREEKTVMGNMLSKAKLAMGGSNGAQQGVPPGAGSPFSKEPVKYIAEGFHVEAIVYEHERFSNRAAGEKMSWSTQHLNVDTDPKPFSMMRDVVPMPSVGAASPDQCEWIDEWTPVVMEGRTDAEGWIYGEGFGSLAKPDGSGCCHFFNIHEHRVRARGWHRYARKTPEKEQLDVEEDVVETGKEKEERVHKEMLERLEKAKQLRQKFYFQWCVAAVELEGAVAPGSAFLVVEHFAARQRSAAVPQRGAGLDAGTVNFPINDCSGQFDVCPGQVVGFGVWASLSLGRKNQLGYGSYCVPDTKGEAVDDLQEAAIDVVNKEGKEIGKIRFDWTMQPANPDDDAIATASGAAGNKVGVVNVAAPAAGETSHVLHTAHCVLELSVMKVHKIDERVVERGRGNRWGCLAFLMPGGEPKAFLRIKYRGLVSNMVLESNRCQLNPAATEFNFSTFLAVRHLVPVVVELWYERGSPGNMTQEMIGDVRLEFLRSGLEVVQSERLIVAGSDMAHKIRTAQIAALPPGSKPQPKKKPDNPMLEDLIASQNRRKPGSNNAAAAAAAAATIYDNTDAEEKSKNGADIAVAEAEAAADGLSVLPKPQQQQQGASSSPLKGTSTDDGLPKLMTTAGMMSLRYKYVVEGEATGTTESNFNVSSGGDGAAPAADSGAGDDKKKSAASEAEKPSAAAAAAPEDSNSTDDKGKKTKDSNSAPGPRPSAAAAAAAEK